MTNMRDDMSFDLLVEAEVEGNITLRTFFDSTKPLELKRYNAFVNCKKVVDVTALGKIPSTGMFFDGEAFIDGPNGETFEEFSEVNLKGDSVFYSLINEDNIVQDYVSYPAAAYFAIDTMVLNPTFICRSNDLEI